VARTTYVYRPNNPHADEDGFVSAAYAEPLNQKFADAPMVMGDIKSFVSPVDKTVISSRSQLREHERAHGVKQIGNDWAGRSKPKWWDHRKEIARTGKVPDHLKSEE
jgi:hypothetical protein